jgi:hypothetical protein
MHDPQSECAALGPEGSLFCTRTCLSKDAEVGEGKCLNRTDVVCLSEVTSGVPLAVERQSGLCIPFCGSDEDCPEGRYCHRQGGFCTDFISPGASIGSACTIDADCDGNNCEDRDDAGVGVCTANCVLGSLSGCGYGRDVESRDAACVVPVVAAGRFSEGPGDLGLCLELCDVPEDCQQASAGFACRPLNPGLATFLGRPGACGRP